MGVATIQLRSGTRDRLKKLKLPGGESYDSLLNRLLTLVPDCDDEGQYSDRFRGRLLLAREDLSRDRLVEHSSVKLRLRL